MDPLIGQTIDGRFEVRARLGHGGMGTVYRAYQRSVDREVAIKLMDPAFSKDPVAVRRFEREAQLASKLSQPNTVSVFDFGTANDGRMFIAMELIRGRTLHRIVQTEGAFGVERAARVVIQICDALDAAHRLGIVHRDLKLDNVMVLDDPPGRDLVKVLDFGLAKQVGELDPRATGTGIVVGTPRYIAPEVAVGGAMAPAADVYAVGVILAELVLGRPLWESNNLSELLVLKLAPRAAVIHVPLPLHALVNEMIAANPQHRPSAAATRERLSNLQQSAPILAAPGPSAPEIAPTVEVVATRGRRTRRWGPVGFALLGVTVVGLVIVGFVVPSGSSAPRDAAPPEQVVAMREPTRDPWNVGSSVAIAPLHGARIPMQIDADVPGVVVMTPSGGPLDFRPTPVTLMVSGETPFMLFARWPEGSAQSVTYVRSLDRGRHILLHDPRKATGVVRHSECPDCGPPPLRTPVIVHVTSKPSKRQVTVNDESEPIGTTPFDLYLDLDAPTITLNTWTSQVAVTPDHDQSVLLTGEPERSR